MNSADGQDYTDADVASLEWERTMSEVTLEMFRRQLRYTLIKGNAQRTPDGVADRFTLTRSLRAYIAQTGDSGLVHLPPDMAAAFSYNLNAEAVARDGVVFSTRL